MIDARTGWLSGVGVIGPVPGGPSPLKDSPRPRRCWGTEGEYQHDHCDAGETGAAAVVAGETLLFAGNRCRCPLTELAERYGAEHGPVTDIYLPKWFAHNMPAIHAPLLVLMAYLHARNLIHPRAPLANRARGTSPRRCP